MHVHESVNLRVSVPIPGNGQPTGRWCHWAESPVNTFINGAVALAAGTCQQPNGCMIACLLTNIFRGFVLFSLQPQQQLTQQPQQQLTQQHQRQLAQPHPQSQQLVLANPTRMAREGSSFSQRTALQPSSTIVDRRNIWKLEFAHTKHSVSLCMMKPNWDKFRNMLISELDLWTQRKPQLVATTTGESKRTTAKRVGLKRRKKSALFTEKQEKFLESSSMEKRQAESTPQKLWQKPFKTVKENERRLFNHTEFLTATQIQGFRRRMSFMAGNQQLQLQEADAEDLHAAHQATELAAISEAFASDTDNWLQTLGY